MRTIFRRFAGQYSQTVELRNLRHEKSPPSSSMCAEHASYGPCYPPSVATASNADTGSEASVFSSSTWMYFDFPLKRKVWWIV